MHCYAVINKGKTCAMFSVLPSCWTANVRADAPNPRRSLSDPCSSASNEWKECLLECTGDLLNDISDSQEKHLLWYLLYLIYLQSLGPQTSTSTISTASVHQSPWTARTFQLTLITSQLDYCNSFTWFAPKIPPQTETHADPCCPYHPDLPPLRTEPQFSNSLKSCFSPLNRSIISLTEMVKSTLHSKDFHSTAGKHADVQGGTVFNMQIFTVLFEPCWTLLQQDAPSEFALKWNVKGI